MKVQLVPVVSQKENSGCDSIPFYQEELGSSYVYFKLKFWVQVP